jgi:hypothetical protein
MTKNEERWQGGRVYEVRRHLDTDAPAELRGTHGVWVGDDWLYHGSKAECEEWIKQRVIREAMSVVGE